MKFSQRISKKPIRTAIQVESMDDVLRTKLWNFIYAEFLENLPTHTYQLQEQKNIRFVVLWHELFELPIDGIPHRTNDVVTHIRNWYFDARWFEIYDLLEILIRLREEEEQPKLTSLFNSVLEQEMSGYRIIGAQVTPITDEHELREIELALENSRQFHLSGVSEHLSSALDMLADRQNPDFRNSIKESISAVEAMAKRVSGKPKAELDAALNSIERTIAIHPALKKAFISIYGYTSDGDGIRHALSEQSTCDFEDSKYMLVSCAAFINYLIVKAQKAGITL